jgi:pyruvate dehydrogenase E2 component (dihydrolipoamide acetyltransferase)
MPKAGMAMEEGTIIKWLKKVGERVEMGEPLLEIHTDKVNMEIEAAASGILLQILAQEGEVVPVTHIIGYIGSMGEEAVDKVPATPLARTLAKAKGIDLKTVKGTGQYGEIKGRDIEKVQVATATPLAERIAKKNNIDLEKVQGSGFKGKVRKEDIVAFEEKEYHKDISTKETKNEIQTHDRKSLAGMRKIIAERMLASHVQVPPVTLNTKADVTELSVLKNKITTTLGSKISFNDFVIKATAKALEEYPNINVSLQGQEILYKKEINVGMAVALEDGLIVPVIRNAHEFTLKKLGQKTKELAQKARDGKLMPDEIEGGSFTISNLGMFDILSFTPIINLPESAILGVCAIEDQLKMIDGKIESRKMMGLSLTVDHRLIDGAQGAIFLKRIKTLLENPLEILV